MGGQAKAPELVEQQREKRSLATRLCVVVSIVCTYSTLEKACDILRQRDSSRKLGLFGGLLV